MSASRTGLSLEELLAQAMVLTEQKRFGEALRLFDIGCGAVEEPLKEMPPRALAAYGVALVGDDPRQKRLALKCCRHAIRRAGDDPELYCALARVYVATGSKRRAIHTLELGLRYGEQHEGLRDLREQLGFRAPPVFGSLERSHPLNRLCGRIRHRLTRVL